MNKTRKWKAKLADAMKDLRQTNKIKREDCPGSSQRSNENPNNLKTPDLSYLLRFLRVILKSCNSLPETASLHRLIVLFVLARIEALAFIDEEQLNQLKKNPEYELKHKEDMQIAFKKAWMNDIYEQDRSDLDVLFDFNFFWNGGEVKRGNERIEIQNHGEIIEKHFEEILGSVEKELEIKSKQVIITDNFAPTLANFPEAFTNLVVIVGDYYGGINRLPEYHFELFRKSASNTVLTYLLQLGLPKDAIILADHLIMRATKEKREELLADKNILVIGSPLVNIVSRYLTVRKNLIFNFEYEVEAYSLYEDFYDTLASRLGDKIPVIRTFHKLMDKTEDEIKLIELKDIEEKIDEQELERVKRTITELRTLIINDEAKNIDIIELFKPSRIFSPNSASKSLVRDSNENYALITIGENPWANSEDIASKRSLVAVCGLDRVSTAAAVKVLLDKEELRKHPLGGVISVIEPSDSYGLKEIFESDTEWMTKEYTPQDLLNSMSNEMQISKMRRFFDETKFENYKKLISKYIE